MAIKRMISRDGSLREWQADMITLGKIRTGVFATPAGKRGRPEKLDRFRFTSPDEALIQAVADEYGGDVRPWSPDRDPKRKEFEVITDTAELEVLILNGQKIDPTYEAWAAGRTCVRRCDGEWDVISQAPCLCTGPDKPSNPQDLCKITTRVKVMLQRIAGVGSWMYESHGENFATETGGLMAELVARAAVPVPSLLRLELETRRERNHAKGVFETKSFYVARFRTTAATPQQAITGGDVLTRALSGAPVREIAASPAVVPVVPTVPTVPVPFDIDRLRPAILADIEAQVTVEGLDAIRDKLKSRGVDDARVIEAWVSKSAGVMAAMRLREEAVRLNGDPADRAEVQAIQEDMEHLRRPYRVLVTGSRTWTDAETINAALDVELAAHPDMVLVDGMCEQGADALALTWAGVNGVTVEPYRADWNGPDGKRAGFVRNQVMVDTRPDIVLSFNRGESNGTEHCTQMAENKGLKVLRFRDNTPVEREAPERQPSGIPLKEYRVGDTVTVGGIEFTKISDNPFEPGSDAAKMFDYGRGAVDENGCYTMPDGSCVSPGPCIHTPVDGTVETTGPVLPDVPGDDHDAGELYTMIMTGASQQKPPLTTGEVNSLITRTFGLASAQHADGLQLARLRAGLKAGTVAWR